MTFILLLAAASGAAPPSQETIVVTASREPVEARQSVVPVNVVATEESGLGDALGAMVADLLRTTPGVSVSVSGPRGSQTQIRIRGAEANHSLLFVDGIRFNDPAAGNEARFELLTAGGFDQIEISRGPQSALWGSEAIGGVIAATTGSAPETGYRLDGLAEYGAADTKRLSGRAMSRIGRVDLVATAGWLSSDGFDSFDGNGDRDGFDNRRASLKAVFRPVDEVDIGAVGHWIEGESEYDGFDPLTFRRADTLDSTRNEIAAVRAWAEAKRRGWTVKLDGSFLASANRNRLAETPLNRTSGRRLAIGAQLSKTAGDHRVTLAGEHQGEDFRARDQAFFGATDQDRSRDVDAAVVEWQADWRPWLTTDLALRHDSFSAFRDATSFHAGATARPIRRLSLVLRYGEGVAQPTFYDLYGFFPGSFAGNPGLRPERSEEWQAGLTWRGRRLSLVLTGFTARLTDEIIDVFDPATFRSTTANATGISRRRGLEAEAELRLSRAARLNFYYTWLDAEEQQVAGALAVREVRRPRHNASLVGHGEAGRLTWGASITYVGERGDTDFDSFPARAVTLDAYLLAAFRLAWRLTPALEAYVRAENAFDARYQDVFGYRTPGRTAYAGLRLRFRD
ncbi:MAG TPA: TonB-dependent receptor [Allosphingosinicella sp.]